MSNCGCTAADGEEYNMRVCEEHLKIAYVEAKRLFPKWPDRDLWEEARIIAIRGGV